MLQWCTWWLKNNQFGTVYASRGFQLWSQAAFQPVGFSTFLFTYDHDGVFVRQSPVDRALHKYIVVLLYARILSLSHYSTPLDTQNNDVWTTIIDTIFSGCKWQTTYIGQGKIGVHAIKMDVKQSISVSFSHYHLLDNWGLWPLIYWVCYRNHVGEPTRGWCAWPLFKANPYNSFWQNPIDTFCDYIPRPLGTPVWYLDLCIDGQRPTVCQQTPHDVMTLIRGYGSDDYRLSPEIERSSQVS